MHQFLYHTLFLDTTFNILKKYRSNETYESGIEAEPKDQIDEHNAALEDLIRSKEAKTGRFSHKLKFWHKSNDAKLSTANEKYEVRIFYISPFFTTQRYTSNLLRSNISLRLLGYYQ